MGKKKFDPASQIQRLESFGEFGGVNPSITDSSTFTFMTAQTMSDTFHGEAEGCFLYSRHWNPTNKNLSDAIAAMEAYAAYRDANGSPGGTYLWFPVMGGGEEDFDFKAVDSFASIEAYGNYYQWSVENAAYLKSGELFDGLLDCDVSRGYVGDTIVNTMTGN